MGKSEKWGKKAFPTDFHKEKIHLNKQFYRNTILITYKLQLIVVQSLLKLIISITPKK